MAIFRLALLGLFIGLASCNSRPTLAPAEGAIFKPDGTPYSGAVYFLPTVDDGFCKRYGDFPSGVADDQGNFEMYLGKRKDPGIPPGEYRVVIRSGYDQKVPGRYEEYQGSPWTVTIPRRGKTDIALTMEN